MSTSTLDLIKKQFQKDNKTSSQIIKTPFEKINKKLGGFKKGEVIIIGGRTGMGATTLAIQLAIHFSKNQHLLFNSLDKNEEWITNKIISQLEDIPFCDISAGKFNEQDKPIFESAIAKSSIHHFNTIYKVSALSELEKEMKKEKYDVIIIDLIQELVFEEKYQINDFLKAIEKLNQLAKKQNVCIIATSSLSNKRVSEHRCNSPMLKDLKIPKRGEFHLDKIFMLYTPEFDHITEDAEGNSTIGLSEFNLLKNATGKQESFTLRINDNFTSFQDWN